MQMTNFCNLGTLFQVAQIRDEVPQEAAKKAKNIMLAAAWDVRNTVAAFDSRNQC
jgi:hypothetical protein